MGCLGLRLEALIAGGGSFHGLQFGCSSLSSLPGSPEAAGELIFNAWWAAAPSLHSPLGLRMGFRVCGFGGRAIMIGIANLEYHHLGHRDCGLVSSMSM